MYRVLSLFFIVFPSLVAANTCAVNDDEKVSCNTDQAIDQSTCLNIGCCWAPVPFNEGVPHCYKSGVSASGYELAYLTANQNGFSGQLTFLGNDVAVSTYGPSLQTLSLEVVALSASSVEIKIADATQTRWEIPESIIPRPTPTGNLASAGFQFVYTSSPFSFQIVRSEDQQVVFDFQSTNFLFKDQYIEFETISNNVNSTIFGLGESTRLAQAWPVPSLITLWAADEPAHNFNTNLYGSYPVYFQLLPNGRANGAVLFNSNGMDVTLLENAINYKVIGGVVDLVVFIGPTPADALAQYTAFVGRPAMVRMSR